MFCLSSARSGPASPSMATSCRRGATRAALVGIALLCGCATEPARPPILRTRDPIIYGHAALARAPAQDRVLWDYRLAASALRLGNLAEAKAKLDDAITRIGGIRANDETAKKARGYFSPERDKTFIGEPYERVMAYYYRGLLY